MDEMYQACMVRNLEHGSVLPIPHKQSNLVPTRCRQHEPCTQHSEDLIRDDDALLFLEQMFGISEVCGSTPSGIYSVLNKTCRLNLFS